MNSSEKLYKEKTFKRKFDDEPMQKITSAPEVSEQDLHPRPENEKLSFAVDWQMEDIYIQFDSRNNALDFSMRKFNMKRTDQDPASAKSGLYIPDW